MKKQLFAFAVALMAVFAAGAQTSDTTATFKVWGNCGMCKTRIEKAAFGKGVKAAEWDTDSQTLRVTYRKDKTDVLTIEKRVASVGHDTENVRADDRVYQNLHGCCQYDRKAQ